MDIELPNILVQSHCMPKICIRTRGGIPLGLDCSMLVLFTSRRIENNDIDGKHVLCNGNHLQCVYMFHISGKD